MTSHGVATHHYSFFHFKLELVEDRVDLLSFVTFCVQENRWSVKHITELEMACESNLIISLTARELCRSKIEKKKEKS